jgi:hypothetical protein
MRSGDAAQAVVCVEESTRLGCVFVRFLCVSRRDGLSVADVYGFATTCVEAWLLPLNVSFGVDVAPLWCVGVAVAAGELSRVIGYLRVAMKALDCHSGCGGS